MPRFVRTFCATIYLKLYTPLLPADRMNSKTKIKIYKKVIKEVCKEFISNKINELCPEQGISTEEVR